jgi:integrase
LAAFRADQTALLVRLAADTGARLGELTALQIGDLDGDRLTIERAAKGHGVIGPTKTHRRRTITLGSVVAHRWDVHVATWKPNVEARRAGWLFTASPESLDAIGLSGITLRFRRVRAAADVPGATLHRLRHTVGTHLVRNGDLLAAKTRLGHDNLSTTLRNYVDDDGIDDRGAAMSLDRLYNDAASQLDGER